LLCEIAWKRNKYFSMAVTFCNRAKKHKEVQ
jgi:hypothetical protein